MSEPVIRLPKPVVELISKDEFCVLAYYLTQEPKTLKNMNRTLGLGTGRIIKCLSSLRDHQLIIGKVTQPETIEVLPTILPQQGDEICKIPEWVILDLKGRAADKHLLAYYFREKGNFNGSISELASGIGLKHRNANYCMDYLVGKKIIRRSNEGHKVHLELLERPKRGFLKTVFGG
jgi:hypothetical protein